MFSRVGLRRNSKNDGEDKIEKGKRRGFSIRNKPVEALPNPERRRPSQEPQRRRSSEVSMSSSFNNFRSPSSSTPNDADNEGANDDASLMLQSVLSSNVKTSKMSALHEMASASSSESSKTATSRGSFTFRRSLSTSGKTVGQAAMSLGNGDLVETAMQRFRRPVVMNQSKFFPAHISMPTRRALEVEVIQYMDRLVINKHMGEFWFLMDAVWTNKWVEFVMGMADPPGEITNSNLFVKEDQDEAWRPSRLDGRAAQGVLTASSSFHSNGGLVQGLKKMKDYRAVHPMVWYTFREMYGKDSAPEICRCNADLYSEPVQPYRKQRVEEDARTKATYQLRAFLERVDNSPSASMANMP